MPDSEPLDHTHVDAAPGPRTALPDNVGREILKAVAGIQYGSVEVLIHDSRVVQIEAREKIRFQEIPKKRV